jgi:hypothetical protein
MKPVQSKAANPASGKVARRSFPSLRAVIAGESAARIQLPPPMIAEVRRHVVAEQLTPERPFVVCSRVARSRRLIQFIFHGVRNIWCKSDTILFDSLPAIQVYPVNGIALLHLHKTALFFMVFKKCFSMTLAVEYSKIRITQCCNETGNEVPARSEHNYSPEDDFCSSWQCDHHCVPRYSASLFMLPAQSLGQYSVMCGIFLLAICSFFAKIFSV